MMFPYRKALGLAEDERILFKTPELENHAVGVLRGDSSVFIKVLGSVSKDFKGGPDDVTHWHAVPVEAARLAVKVYDIMQNDDWKNHTQGLYFETWRS